MGAGEVFAFTKITTLQKINCSSSDKCLRVRRSDARVSHKLIKNLSTVHFLGKQWETKSDVSVSIIYHHWKIKNNNNKTKFSKEKNQKKKNQKKNINNCVSGGLLGQHECCNVTFK